MILNKRNTFYIKQLIIIIKKTKPYSNINKNIKCVPLKVKNNKYKQFVLKQKYNKL